MFNITIDDALCIKTECVQIKYPRSKKSRIRKKWAKQSKNFKQTVKHVTYRFGNSVIMSSATFECVKATAKKAST
jgi:hypothetical protein